jgi:RimJ/RimL family protein N-acetyltransferase
VALRRSMVVDVAPANTGKTQGHCLHQTATSAPAQSAATIHLLFIDCQTLFWPFCMTDFSENSTVEVRPAKERDAKAIAEIQASASQAAFKALFPGETMPEFDSLKKSQAYWREAIEFGDPQVIVAVDGNTVTGFVGFDRSRDPKTPATMGEIWAIYASPSQWGKGVGLALWDAAREGLQDEGCTKVSAWVPLGYERALRFFDMAGFKREMTSIKTVPMGNVKIEEIRYKRDLS